MITAFTVSSLSVRKTSTTAKREICTYVYEKEEVIAPRTTTQVTYDQKPETMKVTTCGAA